MIPRLLPIQSCAHITWLKLSAATDVGLMENPSDLHWDHWTGFNEYIRKCFKDGKTIIIMGCEDCSEPFCTHTWYEHDSLSATRVTEERRKELPDSKDVVKMREDCGVNTEKLPDWHPDSPSRTGTSQNFRVIDNSELVECEFLDLNRLLIKIVPSYW